MRPWERAARDDLRRILEAGLLSVSPYFFLRERVRADGDTLWIDGRAADLRAETVRAVAVGKAAKGMASQATWLRPAEAAVVTPDGATVDGWEAFCGGHPVPTEGSARAGERILEIARATGPDDLLVVLLSGGASALADAPAVPLEDVGATTDLLLRGGAPIHELNAVRKHLSRLKGGRLAAACRGRILALAVSDVPGDDPAVIGSGPVSPDASTFRDAADALQSRGLWEAAPATVRAHLEAGLAGEVPETPKPGDRVFDRVDYRIVAANALALEAAEREAARLGYATSAHRDALAGEAREMGDRIAKMSREALAAATADGRPRAILLGGETTVTVRGGGKGGRNQETALAIVEGIAGRPIVAACVGTDGVDGPTDAAGAVVDGLTLARAKLLGLEVEEHLAENDAYPYFAALHDLVQTGPTGTNVMDIAVVLVGPQT